MNPLMTSPPNRFYTEGTPKRMSAPLSSHRFDDVSDNESVLSLSETQSTRVAQTPAEKAREKKLRDDPMALVLGPFYVECRRCGVRIKLSEKSLFDVCHWSTHRGRCVKKPPGTLKRRGPQATSALPSKRRRGGALPDSQCTPSQKKISILSASSPPMPMDMEPPSSGSNTPSVPSHPPFLPDMFSSEVLKDYLLRSNRKKLATFPTTLAHRQEWSWSQLTRPQFIQQDPHDDDDDDDDNNNIPGFIGASESDETFWATPPWQRL